MLFKTILIWLFFASSLVYAESEPINYYKFLYDHGAISSLKKNDKELITRAEFWKISMSLAWYEPSYDKKYYITPIKGISYDDWYSPYAKMAYEKGLLDSSKDTILAQWPIKKLESIDFIFKLYWINAPFFNDVIMDYKDVVNDHPLVSKCLILKLCRSETNRIFWANSPLPRLEAYKFIVDSYNYVYENEANKIKDSKSEWVELLSQMVKSLEKEYYKRDDLKKEDLIYWAAEWMANAVWDKYTQFMRPDASTVFNDSIDWSFEGIWAYVEKDKDWVRIITPINGSPAQKAWLRANDIILEIEWFKMKDFTLNECINKIKGPRWSKANFLIQRWDQQIKFEIVRDKVDVPSIEASTEQNVLILKINQFQKNTDEEFERQMKLNESMDNVIIDVRSNPWWYLDTVENILSMFVPTWEPILNVVYSYISLPTKSSDVNKFEWKKLEVLIDGASASASEILAWTLQDYNLAKVIWEKSFWKWTVQTVETYIDGSQLKYTIAEWQTAKWNSIQWTWVIPDIVVYPDNDVIWDEVLKRAIREFR